METVAAADLKRAENIAGKRSEQEAAAVKGILGNLKA